VIPGEKPRGQDSRNYCQDIDKEAKPDAGRAGEGGGFIHGAKIVKVQSSKFKVQSLSSTVGQLDKKFYKLHQSSILFAPCLLNFEL